MAQDEGAGRQIRTTFYPTNPMYIYSINTSWSDSGKLVCVLPRCYTVLFGALILYQMFLQFVFLGQAFHPDAEDRSVTRNVVSLPIYGTT